METSAEHCMTWNVSKYSKIPMIITFLHYFMSHYFRNLMQVMIYWALCSETYITGSIIDGFTINKRYMSYIITLHLVKFYI